MTKQKEYIAIILQNPAGDVIFHRVDEGENKGLLDLIGCGFAESDMVHKPTFDALYKILNEEVSIREEDIDKDSILFVDRRRLREDSKDLVYIWTCKIKCLGAGANSYIFDKKAIDHINGNKSFINNGKEISKVMQAWKAFMENADGSTQMVVCPKYDGTGPLPTAVTCPECGKSRLLSTGQCPECGYGSKDH